ncbi:MAG: PQQ-binding-like beta-propeller repeat protein, partial [Bryobacterales bacterium]
MRFFARVLGIHFAAVSAEAAGPALSGIRAALRVGRVRSGSRWALLAPVLLAGAFVFAATSSYAAEAPWPQFRGPDANPVGGHARLPERWSKTENVEWSVEVPGRGWSSPIVAGGKVFLTAATTEGASKEPQIGTDYSNEYAAELSKQGLSDEEVMKRVMARDHCCPAISRTEPTGWRNGV